MKSILVPTDGSLHAQAAIGIACDLAEVHGSEISFLHTLLADRDVAELLRLPQLPHFETGVGERLEEIASARVEPPSAEALMRNPDCPLRPAPRDLLVAIGSGILQDAEAAAWVRNISCRSLDISDGDPAQQIVVVARQEAVDTIVMGSRGLSTIDALTIGSVSQSVCQKAPCRCIVVH